MKSVNCNIIRDLLPSYGTELLSKDSNNLIEEHVKICSECRKVMRNMNGEENSEKVYNQDEDIAYLKGYRKKKILSIIMAIIITTLVILNMFLFGIKILLNHNFYMNIKDVKICYIGEDEKKDNKVLLYEMTSNATFLQPFCCDYDIDRDTDNKIIYMKVTGVFTGIRTGNARSFCRVEINDDTECVYLIDDKDNKLKIWDKNQGVLTE